MYVVKLGKAYYNFLFLDVYLLLVCMTKAISNFPNNVFVRHNKI